MFFFRYLSKVDFLVPILCIIFVYVPSMSDSNVLLSRCWNQHQIRSENAHSDHLNFLTKLLNSDALTLIVRN